jgi:hypothetical protein
MTLPLTMRALEFGKSLTILGGRPISSALVNSLVAAGLLVDIWNLLVSLLKLMISIRPYPVNEKETGEDPPG